MEFKIVGRCEGLFPYQAWPTVAKDDTGTLYAASSGHRLNHVCPFGKDYLYVSRDQGASWQGPVIANDTYLDDRDAGLCAWGEGNLFLCWFNLPPDFYRRRAADPKPHNGALRSPLGMAGMDAWDAMDPAQLPSGSFARVSRDGGNSWSEPFRIPLTSPHGPVSVEGDKLLFIGKEMSWGGELERGAVYAMDSADGGRTWNTLGKLPCPAGYGWGAVHEPHGILLRDGTILAALRVEGNSDEERLVTYVTRSADGGRSWTEPVRVGGGAPPHLLEHSSGAVVLVYSKRRQIPQAQCVRISYDGGKTWSEEFAVAPESPDWDHGYPSTVELADGSLLTVFYQKCAGDTYNSILSTRWTLPKKKG